MPWLSSLAISGMVEHGPWALAGSLTSVSVSLPWGRSARDDGPADMYYLLEGALSPTSSVVEDSEFQAKWLSIGGSLCASKSIADQNRPTGGKGSSMEGVTKLAIQLDIMMLLEKHVDVSSENVLDGDLPYCSDLVEQLGGRYLIKYVHSDTVRRLKFEPSGLLGKHCLTPTPIARSDLVKTLLLPPRNAPSWALLVMPGQLSNVRGPRRIPGSSAIEYVAESGIPLKAIAPPGWPLTYK